MQLGMIGLGRMGANIVRRLMSKGHHCVVFDTNAKVREALAKEGATAAGSLTEVVKALSEKPRAVWVMLPAGRIHEETVERLGALLEPDDIIIDGGNTSTRTISVALGRCSRKAFVTLIVALQAASGVSNAAIA